MKYLFVHQNFPGQFLHIARRLAASRDNDVVFITEPNANHLPGVRKVPYAKPGPSYVETHPIARELDAAGRRAAAVAGTALRLKALGFTPDIIIGHHGWGELLNLPDVWPGVPLLGYMEFFYRIEGVDVGFDPEFPTSVEDYPRIRAKNAVNLIALGLGGYGQTPTRWQMSTYPDWAQHRITLLPEGVNLDKCKPDPTARRQDLMIGNARIGRNDKLVTYVARDLEPYRGFHVMMRAIPHMLRARKDVRVVLVGGDGVSYGTKPEQGTWREAMLQELGSAIDPDRVTFPGRLEYATYVRLLQRSDAHVYLSYPFVASWSLREALATGCVVLGSDTPPVREFIEDGHNGRLVPFFDPRRLAAQVLRVLEDQPLSRRMREGARAYAERHLSMEDYLTAYEGLIGGLIGTSIATAKPLPPPPSRKGRGSRTSPPLPLREGVGGRGLAAE
ncbi:MAG TPA: glycosyltransferase family 4 protein [Acetobacteraceae bacterium]|nr:glycosyltransferase family 4 protein [Acetobacteraceae bacterium]